MQWLVPIGVMIETVVFGDGGRGAFSATGDAVDAGEWRAEGDFTNLGHAEEGDEGDPWFEDEMICSDKSGTLVLRVVTPIDDEASDEEFDPAAGFGGTWSVLRGTGDYDGLSRSGDFDAVFEPSWQETYTGTLSSP